MANYLTVIAIITYLSLASVLTTVLAFAIPAAQIGIPSPANSLVENTTEYNFLTTCNNATLGSVTVDRGDFVCNTTYGLMSNTDGVNRAFFVADEELDYWYNSTYDIRNPDGREFKIFLYWADLGWEAYELRVEDDRFAICLSNWGICFTTFDQEMYAASAETNLNITVNFHARTGSYVIHIEETDTTFSHVEDRSLDYFGQYYSGVEVTGKNLGIADWLTSVKTQTTTYDITNPFSFFFYLVSLVTWFPPGWTDPLMILLNVILFKLPGIALFVAIISMIRGE